MIFDLAYWTMADNSDADNLQNDIPKLTLHDYEGDDDSEEGETTSANANPKRKLSREKVFENGNSEMQDSDKNGEAENYTNTVKEAGYRDWRNANNDALFEDNDSCLRRLLPTPRKEPTVDNEEEYDADSENSDEENK
ncbi:unnamed protein product [Caenorhabditis sp. 36 PRJEB53466]|nr:unnamed protein product [Caenorhabditis sp. 36 PRJEB53466]